MTEKGTFMSLSVESFSFLHLFVQALGDMVANCWTSCPHQFIGHENAVSCLATKIICFVHILNRHLLWVAVIHAQVVWLLLLQLNLQKIGFYYWNYLVVNEGIVAIFNKNRWWQFEIIWENLERRECTFYTFWGEAGPSKIEANSRFFIPQKTYYGLQSRPCSLHSLNTCTCMIL